MIKPFYSVVDFLYNSVMDLMPQAVQDRDMASAFTLGFLGIYGVVNGLQWASKNIMDKIIPGFDEKWLPILEKLCICGMVGAPLLYAVVDPEGIKAVMTQHETYTSGMIGVGAGSVTGAGQDLHERSKKKSLEEII